MAAGSCVAQLLWIKQQLKDYGVDAGCVEVLCDNKSAIVVSKNPALHSRMKHVNIRHHFIRDHVSKKDVELVYIPTADQKADIFTKPLSKDQFVKLRGAIGMSNPI